MSVQSTLGRFPIDARTKDACGLPFACVAQPFAPLFEILSRDGKCSVPSGPSEYEYECDATQVGRCQECFGYISRYCYFDYRSWTCALCGSNNPIKKGTRYHNVQNRTKLPELQSGFVDLVCEKGNHDEDDEDEGKGQGGREVDRTPAAAFVALVDATGTEEQLEIAKAGVAAGLEALPPNAKFGIASFEGDSIALFDFRGTVPSSASIPLGVPAAAASPSAQHDDTEDLGPSALGEVVPLGWFLADATAAHKEAATSALDAIAPLASAEIDPRRNLLAEALACVVGYVSGGPQGDDDVDEGEEDAGGRSRAAEAGVACSRVACFLHGPAPAGSRSRNLKGGRGRRQGVVSPTEGFWEDLGSFASRRGVTVDLYATAASTSSAEPFDLRSMRRLPELTGGRLRLYPSPGESNAPQDVFAALKEPVALNATLRMRTSNEFDVSGVFGGLVEDPRYPHLYHLAACGPHACFAFDFKFTGSGFSREPELKPTVQLAFRYEVFAPVHGKAEAEGEDKGEGREYAMQRRLRVYTKQFPVAKSALDLYEGADAHATICVLVHKLARVVEDQGFQEARALCEDWLINLLGEYNLSLNRRLLDQGGAVENPDLDFVECKALQPLLPLVYGLLRGTSLSASVFAQDPDRWSFLRSCFASLPPKDLSCALYPQLSTFSNNRGYRRVPLSWRHLNENEGVIYMADALFVVVVYYTREAQQTQEWPPPHGGLIRREIEDLGMARSVQPRAVFLREGVEDGRVFEELLLDEPAKVGTGSSTDFGYDEWRAELAKEVADFLASPP